MMMFQLKFIYTYEKLKNVVTKIECLFLNICKCYPMESAFSSDNILFIIQTTSMWFQEQNKLLNLSCCYCYQDCEYPVQV